MIFAPSLNTKEEHNGQLSPCVGQWNWYRLLLGSRVGTVALTRPSSFLFLEHPEIWIKHLLSDEVSFARTVQSAEV